MSKKDKRRKTTLLNYNLHKGNAPSAATKQKAKKRRALIYCRVSDSQQEKMWHGLDSQERKNTERCQQQESPIEVAAVFKEPGITGGTTDRKEFNKAIQYIKDLRHKEWKEITDFVVSETSRFCRLDFVDEAFALERKVNLLGVRLIRVSAPFINEDTPEGRAFKIMDFARTALEKRKINQRTQDGRVNRLKNGYRPFSMPPAWYIRNMKEMKEYEDCIDESKWPIVKRGLEMFANGLLKTQSDLRRYRIDEWLSSAGNTKKLQRSFIERTLQLHRIFFYAGYIIYPEWWVEKPIEWRHAGLISLSTAHRIIKRLQLEHKNTNKSQTRSYKMSDEHPLRGVITCPWNERKITSWNTSKMVGKWKNKVRKLYPYYGCNAYGCSHQFNVKKEVLEQEFEALLEKLSIPKPLLNILEQQFEHVRNKYLESSEARKSEAKKKIKSLQRKMTAIQESIVSTSNLKLQNKLEEERATIDAQIDVLKDEMNEDLESQERKLSLYKKAKMLYENPVHLRKRGDPIMRKLLLAVRFDDKIYYYKNQGLKTAENGFGNGLYGLIQKVFPSICNKGELDKTNLINFFVRIQEHLSKYADHIDLIYAWMESLGIVEDDSS